MEGWGGFPINWKDPEFRRIALAAIAPRAPLNLFHPAPDVISIAIHVREGGGFDNREKLKLDDPFKIPPMDFYIEALNRVLPMLFGKKVYCHIFTDCQHPETIAHQIKEAIFSGYPIEFGYRQSGNHHEKNILEDFFSLFNFDILIRPRSNFSIVPCLLSDYAILCYPAEFVRRNHKVLLARIEIEQNEALYSEMLKR